LHIAGVRVGFYARKADAFCGYIVDALDFYASVGGGLYFFYEIVSEFAEKNAPDQIKGRNRSGDYYKKDDYGFAHGYILKVGRGIIK